MDQFNLNNTKLLKYIVEDVNRERFDNIEWLQLRDDKSQRHASKFKLISITNNLKIWMQKMFSFWMSSYKRCWSSNFENHGQTTSNNWYTSTSRCHYQTWSYTSLLKTPSERSVKLQGQKLYFLEQISSRASQLTKGTIKDLNHNRINKKENKSNNFSSISNPTYKKNGLYYV